MTTYWHRKDHEKPAELTDESPMPFGRYKGRKMQDVPGTYLGWLGERVWISQWPSVQAYIIKNKKCLDWEADRAQRNK